MRISRVVLAGFAAAAVPLVPAGIAQAGAAPGHTIQGHAQYNYKDCPVGDACMYTPSGWKNGTPEHRYYKYGCYNLSDEKGNRQLFNNQTGGATFRWYRGYNCADEAGSLNPWWVTPPFDIWPINSVSLNP